MRVLKLRNNDSFSYCFSKNCYIEKFMTKTVQAQDSY